MKRNKEFSDTQLARLVLAALSSRLPAAWTASLDEQPSVGSLRPDAVLRVCAPDGTTVQWIVEAKTGVEPRAIPSVLDQIRRYQDALAGSSALAVAPYLGPRTRAWLAAEDASYVDATGNMRITSDQ